VNNQIKTNKTEIFTAAEPDLQFVSSGTLTCHNYWCNYKTNEPLSSCPKCGRPLLTSQTFRLLGWLLIVPGAVLAIAGALLLILAAPKLVGGMGVKLLVYAIFGLLLAVGLTFMAAGFRQALSGNRSQSLIAFVLILLITIAIIVAIGRAFL